MRRLVFALALLAPATVPAQEAPVRIERGTAGLSAVPLAVENRSGQAIACQAAIAHWYSLEIGRAAPGARLAAELWSDPRTGTVFLLNASQDRMPVQALWCGLAQQPFATRFAVALARRAGSAEPPIRLECAGVENGRLLCRPG